MIVAAPPNTITAKQKELLNKKGYVVIECEDPDKIRVIIPQVPVEANDYYMAALYALKQNDSSSANAYFIKELYRRLSESKNPHQ